MFILALDLKENHFSGQEAALYARPNDELEMAEMILDLLDDPDKRQKMGEFGRRRVESELSWEHSVPHLLAAYGKAGN